MSDEKLDIDQIFSDVVALINENQGVLTLILFIFTIFLGWVSGLFRWLRSVPNLRIRTLEGPTFVCVFGTGRKEGNFNLHRTGIALYLNISNVSVVSTSITSVRLDIIGIFLYATY